MNYRSAQLLTAQIQSSLATFGIIVLTCGTIGAIEATIPTIAQAYTTRLDVVLDRAPSETYDGLVRRAELVARAAAQRGFDRDLLATEVSIRVTGRNGGFEAPVLSLTVTRSQWQARPDARRWATYYRGGSALLGF